MLLTHNDLFNLGQLQLAILGAQSWDECANNIKYGKRTRARTQGKYIKSLMKLLIQYEQQHPDQIKNLLKEKCKDNRILIEEK